MLIFKCLSKHLRLKHFTEVNLGMCLGHIFYHNARTFYSLQNTIKDCVTYAVHCREQLYHKI